MATETETFANLIMAGVAETSPDGATPLAVGPADFCAIWPKAKPILQLLAGIVAFIPGAGTAAGGVLTGLIKVGDQIAATLCR